MDANMVENVLKALETNGYIRLNKVVNGWYSAYCPFHNSGNERKPSFGISLETRVRNGTVYEAGMCHCFTCQYAAPLVTMVAEVLRMHGVHSTGLAWLIDNVPGFEPPGEADSLIPDDMYHQLSNKFALDYIAKISNDAKEYVSEEELSRYRYVVPYMYERKLTDEIIAKYDVGVQVDWIPPGRKKPVPCITFPVRDATGRTLFCVRRSIEGKLFNYPTGVTKPVYGIYELPPGVKTVLVCESCFNCLTSVRYGIPAVALLGTGNDYQIQQLRQLGVQSFVICMDGDEAGRRATAKLKRALKDVAIVWTMTMPDGKDINDCSYDEFMKIYNARE